MKNSNSKLSGKNANSRKAPAVSKTSVVDRKIVRKAQTKQFSFAKLGVVPADEYNSKIVGMEDSLTKAGEEAIDILYELTSASGKKHHVRMRYPIDGFYFEELCDALLDAGLPEDSKLSEAVGLEERVVLGYPNGERIGSFTSRSPVSRKASNGQGSRSEAVEDEETEAVEDEDQVEDDFDDDSEFDDFLEDTDD